MDRRSDPRRLGGQRVSIALAAACAGFLASVAPARAQDPSPINLGLWEIRTDWLGLMTKTEQWCVHEKDVKKFLSGPSNHIYKCVYPVSEAADGVIRYDGACRDKKGWTIKIRGDGTYTPTSVRMHAKGSTHLLGLPVTGSATADGRFLQAECPAGAKSFK